MKKKFLSSFVFYFGLAFLAGSAFGSTLDAEFGQQRENRNPSRRPPEINQARRVVKEPTLLRESEITISLGGGDGMIQPLLGVNAGPSPSGEKTNIDITGVYQECGIKTVRTHDFYGPLDLISMYPDITADPKNPDSYRFSESDKVFRSIVDGGFEPYFRLGDSYNKVRIPQNEKERKNLVQAAVEVIRHYKNGSGNGFKSDFRYAEIWNEPDLNRFWPAGFENFLPFFVETYVELKRQFPALKIGGPGFVVATYKIPRQRKNLDLFLSYLKEHEIEPDFLSFHIYSNNPSEYHDAGVFYRQACQRAGLSRTEIHITEWNTERGDITPGYRLGVKAAPFTTAIWIALQDAGVEASFIYRGTDTSIRQPDFFGMFFADGREKPTAKAFRLWSRLRPGSRKLKISTGINLLEKTPQVNGDLKPLWILAGEESPQKIMLLLTNIGEKEIRYTLRTPRPIKSITVDEIRPPADKTVSSLREKSSLSIAALTVQLVHIEME